MKRYILLALVAIAIADDDLPPSCNKPVYCDSKLLHHVQMARLYSDSKSFVDLQLRNDEETTLNAFDELLNKTNDNPTKEQLQLFVDEHFDATSEIENWVPSDYSTEPAFLNGVRDETLRQYGKDINAIWPTLGRKVKSVVLEKPELFSFIPVTNGFIIPGGRFRELYYWDAYWIIDGLLISGMEDTARGMIDNLIQLLLKLGKVPNGSRWYYQERSQPPLLSAMMSLYIRATNDLEFLKSHINALELELQYWLDTQLITFEKDGKAYTLLRYYAPSQGPRPESYYEDYTNAQSFKTEQEQTDFYVEIKSAAESGWDFSTRWFMNPDGSNTGNLTSIHTQDIIPVDLNAIFANALQNAAYFQALLRNGRKSAHWGYLAKQWRNNIREVLWDENDGIWYDYDLLHEQHRKYFYPSNVAPLWMGAVEKPFVKAHALKVLEYLQNSHGLDFPGGVPSSLIPSGEQWDFPNAWPPLVSIVVNALEALGTSKAKETAFQVAQTWVRSCYQGFVENKQMFEKYNVEKPGKVGGGGEYVVQDGFGWSNGVVLEFLAKYGRKLTAYDKVGDESNINANENSSVSSPAHKSTSGASTSLSSESSVEENEKFDSLDIPHTYVYRPVKNIYRDNE